MNSFLQQVAKDLYERYGAKISDITVVFPGKRVSLFFLKYLAEIAGKPMWAPRCMTIQELMQQISGKQSAEHLQLIFDLHTIYQQETQKTESFDNFYFWGEMLLSDFDDIDKYMVNAEDLYQNLSLLKTYENLYNYLSEEQLKSIKQFWSSFNNEASVEMQEKFISVWSVLYPVYKKFKLHLETSNVAYEGMIFRSVAEQLINDQPVELPSSKFALVGFNALNVCERKLFEYLKVHKLADFYWDYDTSYSNDPVHQAGFFLRDNIREFPVPDSWSQHNKLLDKNKIQVFATGSDVAQVKLAGNALQNFSQEHKINEETALILADETLLPQVLYSLPQEITDVNITMGFPMILSQTYSFMDALLTLQQHQKQYNGNVFYYFKYALHVLQHPFVLQHHQKDIEGLIAEMQEQNKVYFSLSDIPDAKLLKMVFTPSTHLFQWLKEILSLLIHNMRNMNPPEGNNRLELEFLFHMYGALQQISENLQKKNIDVTIRTLRRMMHRVIANFKVPFSGEPLKGLQILGLLETRAIDFKNIIILSFNEGIYPKTSASPSYIPYNLRKGFGLPTLEHQDSIFAYYFYRLLQRAEQVKIFYNTKTDGLQSGERSRFLHQIIYQNRYSVKEHSMVIPLSNKAVQTIEIKQSKDTLDILRKYEPGNDKILSPSALNVYLDCSIKFYFKYIAGIPEPEDVSEEVDPADFGNILHDSMEAIYRQMPTKIIEVNDILHLLKDSNKIDKTIEMAFMENFEKNGRGPSGLGNNLIVKDVVGSYVRQILKIDVTYAPFEIVEMENQHQQNFQITANSDLDEIVLGGKIDRVDKINGITRIIDYKTGKASHEFDTVESLFKKEDFTRNRAVFQTFLYGLLYQSNQQLPLQPGLYPMKNIFDASFDPRIFQMEKRKRISIEDFEQVKDEFADHLQNLINEIFSIKTVFKKTEEQRFCGYCTYKNICRR